MSGFHPFADADSKSFPGEDAVGLSADTYLNLSCRLERIAQDYCAETGCPADQGVEALLSAAAHYALWSQQTKTFMRVADKLHARIEAALRNHPEFFGQESVTSPRARRDVKLRPRGPGRRVVVVG
jgi:hypothetical protein